MYKKKEKKGILKKFFCMAGSALAIMLLGGITAQAREVTVENGDIQAALSQAETETESLTVVIPEGEYTVNGILYVYSNTVIEATGARIVKGTNAAGEPLLTAMGSASNVTVHGGTWVAGAWAPVQLNGVQQWSFDGINVESTYQYGINLINSNFVTIKDSTFANCGINAEGSSSLTVSGNSIQNPKALGIRAYATGNNLIQGNTVINSGRTGIQLEYDSASVVDRNVISGSALTGVVNDHGEGLVVTLSNETKVTGNTVTDTHSNVVNNGNGIIVGNSENVTVDSNVVTNSGNHGIQVTYSSKGAVVSNNQISGSGRMGISVSRGSQANLVKNTVLKSAVNGIVYDGSEGVCSGMIDGCTIENTLGADAGNAGIWILGSVVNITNSKVSDGASRGMIFTQGSTVTADNNQICQTNVMPDGFGVVINGGSTIRMSGNRIGNFGTCGIYVVANTGSTVEGTNNTVTIKNLTGYALNAINIADGASNMLNNQILNPVLTVTNASGQNYYNNIEAGVVINGERINVMVTDGGQFSVKYPTQSNTDHIVLYVKNSDGNVICINAPNGFTLDGTQDVPGGDTPEGDVDVEQVERFVTRLYQNTLNRKPDAGGLANWVNLLASGEMTGAEVAYGFFFSNEFAGKNLGDEEYVNVLYQTMFGQAGDEAGRRFWLGELETGFSRLYVYHGFAESVQFENLCAEYGIIRGTVTLTEPRDLNRGVTQFVSRIYTKALSRKLDYEGLNTWCGEILSKRWTPEQVVEGFIFSKEFTEKNLSDGDFVDVLYATYFDRKPDAGRATWINLLSNGGTRQDVVNGFSGAQEFHNLVASFNLP